MSLSVELPLALAAFVHDDADRTRRKFRLPLEILFPRQVPIDAAAVVPSPALIQNVAVTQRIWWQGRQVGSSTDPALLSEGHPAPPQPVCVSHRQVSQFNVA